MQGGMVVRTGVVEVELVASAAAPKRILTASGVDRVATGRPDDVLPKTATVLFVTTLLPVPRCSSKAVLVNVSPKLDRRSWALR
jgi:hypothetical protein